MTAEMLAPISRIVAQRDCCWSALQSIVAVLENPTAGADVLVEVLRIAEDGIERARRASA